MTTPSILTGYGLRKGLVVDGNEDQYELWEVKLVTFMRIQKLYDVFVPSSDEGELDAANNANAFAELVQCLDDRSLSLIIPEARDDGRKTLKVLREHYQGNGKPRVIALYTKRTSLRKDENETTTDYIIRAKTAPTALKTAEEVISDGLLIAMVLKGLPRSYKTFSTMVIQREKQMTFSEVETALRNYKENEKSCNPNDSKDNVMYPKQNLDGKCYKCDKKGHKSSECWMKTDKWRVKCRSKTHNTKDCKASKKDAAKTMAEAKEDDTEIHTFAFTLQETRDRRRRREEDSSLLVETGATSHIITDRTKFVSFANDFDTNTVNTHTMELA